MDIKNTQQTIAESQTELGAYLKNLDKTEGESVVGQILSTETVADAWSDIDANLQIQGAITEKMDMLKAQEDKLTSVQNATKQKSKYTFKSTCEHFKTKKGESLYLSIG